MDTANPQVWSGYIVLCHLVIVTAPLSFIFENTVYHGNSAFSQKIAMSNDEQMLVVM